MYYTDDRNRAEGKTKAFTVAGLGLLLVMAAITFSLGGGNSQLAIAQQTEQQQNQTQNANATTVANTTTTDTFTAIGIITGTIESQGSSNQTSTAGNTSQAGNQTNMTQTAGASSSAYLVGGDWNMDVESGNVTDFRANFTMVRTDGSDHHSHDFTNFKTGNNTDFQLDPTGTSTIDGTADYSVNGTVVWPGIDTTVTIEKAKILTIEPQEQEAREHFNNRPVYGIVLGATGENGTTIVESVPAGGNQTQQEGEGGILDQLTDPFEDLFN